MPIYIYKCPQGHEHQALVKINAPAPVCPTCSNPTEKQVTAASFSFKGNGYYVTDFKNK